jgi:hypothetical protein
MTIATKEEILGARRALKREVVSAEELGEGKTIIVQEMSAAQRELYGEGTLVMDEDDVDEKTGQPRRKPKTGELYARLVVASVVDESGKQVFTEDDVAAVSELPWTLVERICDAANRVSKLDAKALEAAKKP